MLETVKLTLQIIMGSERSTKKVMIKLSPLWSHQKREYNGVVKPEGNPFLFHLSPAPLFIPFQM